MGVVIGTKTSSFYYEGDEWYFDDGYLHIFSNEPSALDPTMRKILISISRENIEVVSRMSEESYKRITSKKGGGAGPPLFNVN